MMQKFSPPRMDCICNMKNQWCSYDVVTEGPSCLQELRPRNLKLLMVQPCAVIKNKVRYGGVFLRNLESLFGKS